MTQSPIQRLAQSDTWLLELFLALYTLVWGIAILNPLTDTFLTAPRPYSVLAQFPGGEASLGLVIAVIGSLSASIVLLCGLRERMVTTGVGFCIWLAIGFAIAIPTDWAAGGLPHFFLAAISNWLCWSRLRYRGGSE